MRSDLQNIEDAVDGFEGSKYDDEGKCPDSIEEQARYTAERREADSFKPTPREIAAERKAWLEGEI